MTSTLSERFWSRVEVADDCWLWTGGRVGSGYGAFYLGGGVSVPAHRFAYADRIAAIPDGLQVCHRCDTRLCVRPDHLFLGTQRDNMADMVAKGRSRRGSDHWTNRMPDRIARGERAALVVHPESRLVGEKNPNARLDEDAVREIRRLREEGESLSAIAIQFATGKGTISRIVNRKRWRHVS